MIEQSAHTIKVLQRLANYETKHGSYITAKELVLASEYIEELESDIDYLQSMVEKLI